MPQRWAVVLDHPEPSAITDRQLHALVSGWLDVDHWASPKPYSLVPVHEGFDGAPRFEVGALVDEVGARLATGVADLHRRGGRLGGQRCRAAHRQPLLEAEVSWEAMWSTSTPRRSQRLRFETPTTFRSGTTSHPLPLPSSVVRSWNGRWRRHAPPELAAAVDLDVSSVDVAVDHLDGRTLEVATPGRPLIGFVGTVGFRVHERGEVGASVARRLDALAALAEFAGTGSSTTAGLGVTSRLP